MVDVARDLEEVLDRCEEAVEEFAGAISEDEAIHILLLARWTELRLQRRSDKAELLARSKDVVDSVRRGLLGAFAIPPPRLSDILRQVSADAQRRMNLGETVISNL